MTTPLTVETAEYLSVVSQTSTQKLTTQPLRRSFLLMSFTLAFVGGNLFLQQFAHLPSGVFVAITGFVLLLCVSLWIQSRMQNVDHVIATKYQTLIVLLVLGVFFGFIRAWFQGLYYLKHSAPADMLAQDLVLPACIRSLPKSEGSMTRFIISPIHQSKEPEPTNVKRIRLSVSDRDQNMPVFTAGSCWNFSLRMKTTRGLRNTHGFDYERWLYQQKIGATAYLRSVPEPLEQTMYPWIAFRAGLAEQIKKSLPVNSNITPVILGLTLGIRDGLTIEQWTVLQKTGTSHLLAISGLHISVAALFGFYIGKLFWLMLASCKRSNRFCQSIMPLQSGLFIGVVCAIFYAALAGFSVPTQRACCMLIVAAVMLASNFRLKSVSVLSIALLVVLLIDPIAVLGSGTWLSFGAVAILVYLAKRDLKMTKTRTGFLQNTKQKLILITKMQFVLVLLLSIPVAISFSNVSLIAPLVNLVLIPVFSFTVVPVLLMAVLLFQFFPSVAQELLTLEYYYLSAIWKLMDKVASLPFSSMELALTFWQASLLSILLIPMLLPKGLISRNYAGLLILPLIAGFSPDKNSSNILDMQVFDVGQGLAVLVQTREHNLLYDTGPAYRSGSSAAERVLLPAFNAQHIQNLSAMVISHSDNDHAGGWKIIRDELQTEKIFAPEKDPLENSTACVAGMQWVWDAVKFEFIYPFINNISHSKNNNSCVLKISYQDKSILLTGDIEKNAEFALLKEYPDLKNEIVFAAHHGSRSSSTKEFVQAVNAKHVVIPAGFANRWRFPKQDVVERWQQNGAVLHTISKTGQLTFYIDQSGNLKTQSWLQNYCNYWHQDCE